MANMKAMRINAFGGPEVITLEDIPRPTPRAGELLVRVRATSVNPIDWKLREGTYPDLPLPFTPGGDFSGEVEELGSGVAGYRKGDEVYGCIPGSRGAEAEYLTCPTTALAPKPRTLDHVAAASVPLAGMTAWQGLFDNGKLQRGQTVLILGASGGVGSFAVQLAKHAGARVIATGSAAGLARLRALGADVALDYRKERFEDVAKDVDLCLDLVAGEDQRRAAAVIKKGGTLVSALGQPPEELAKGRGITLLGYRQQARNEQLRELAKLIDAGSVKVEVAKVLPLEKASEAEELNRSHKVTGKIVLSVAR
jgi:NADPH:quinone reductase-like Zn-dependent oxidoreductase